MDEWRVQDAAYEADELNPSLGVSPWSGHRGFAYDLLTWRRPGLVVELGTHYGCSFFAFTQAAKDHGLTMRIVAVDTWEGDPHAGQYGEEVIDLVRRTLLERFPDVQGELIRKTFEEALGDVEDESVDLLHIDGFHSYEAVRRDYESWLPKLAQNGIVLFHDVAGDNGYESSLFWAEVKRRHPSFDFPHSFGLGVMFPKGSHWYDELQGAGVLGWMELYRWRADARLAQRQLSDTSEQLEQRWGLVQSLEEMIRARDEAQAAQATLLEERWAVMESLEEMVRARDETIAAQGVLLEERWDVMQNLEEMVRARDEASTAQAALLEERLTLLTTTEQLLASAQEEAAVVRAELVQAQQQINELAGEIERLAQLGAALRAAGAHLAARLPLGRQKT